MKNRAGRYVKQPTGYSAFVPKPLPPNPPIKYDEQMQALLSKADRAIARLDGMVMVLPNPDLFIAMYVKKEALLSSQIEGTQASFEGILKFEADMKPKDDINEIKDVVNYVKALNYGVERLVEIPLSLRLIKEIHKILLKDTRRSSINLGEFRTAQNWIGPAGATLASAIFVPPPVHMVLPSMGELEKFFHERTSIPPLIKIALIHAQFETIHPFVDGNGRIGRLLITFYLLWNEILSKPILYLSFFLKKNREKYYDLLMKVREEGAWEDWIKFFLSGISETSEEAAQTAKEIIRLKEDLLKKIYEKSISSMYSVKLIDLLFEIPVIDVRMILKEIKMHKDTAAQLLKKFEDAGIIKEISGKQRYKKYLFKDYIDIIARGTESR
jgi:Fic family protein